MTTLDLHPSVPPLLLDDADRASRVADVLALARFLETEAHGGERRAAAAARELADWAGHDPAVLYEALLAAWRRQAAGEFGKGVAELLRRAGDLPHVAA